ncbi:iron transporter, partial [Vibrio cholerae]|nr:iron transporter [Vibrio cholerae]
EFGGMRCQPLRRALYLLREIRWNFKESWKV